MPNQAVITVPVQTFNPITSGLCVINDLALPDNGGGSTSLYTIGTKKNGIAVANSNGAGNGAMQLAFNVVDAANPGGTSPYTVVGLGMSNNGLTNGANPGAVDFTLNSLNANQVVLNNRYKKGNGQKWELYILVTNAAGTVGVIDPEIDNTEQP